MVTKIDFKMDFLTDISNQCNYCFENEVYIDYAESQSVCKSCGDVKNIHLFDVEFKDKENNDMISEISLVEEYMSSLIPNEEYKSNNFLKKEHTKENVIKLFLDRILNVPFDIPYNVREKCISLIRKILKQYKLNYKNYNALLVASLYYSYRAENIEHSIEELCTHFDANKKRVHHLMKYIEKDQNMSEYQGRNSKDLLNVYINKLTLLKECHRKMIKKKISKLIDRFEENLEGKTSKTIICSYIVYIFENDQFFKDNIILDQDQIKLTVKQIICQLYTTSITTLNKTMRSIIDQSLYF